jgi:hypothetical protein
MSLSDPDAFYQALVKLHDGLDAERSNLLNARLILLMAAQIDDEQVLHALLRQATNDKRPSLQTDVAAHTPAE